jgi:hypothetical protein
MLRFAKEAPMRRKIAALVLAAAALAGVAAAETWKNAAFMDAECADKFKDNPDKHTVKCAVACEDDGYGILTADGKFLKFDAAGNEKAAAALKDTKKTDHLRATVEGTLDGDQIKVTAFQFD